MNIFKSIGAGLAGMVIGAALSIGTDALLKNAGILPHGNLNVSTPLILAVLFYRSVYNTLGCYVTARLAPSHPMRHALILGAIGTAASVLGAVVTANMNLGPAWYGWTLAALFMPNAWLGGTLYEMQARAKNSAP